MAKKGKKRSRKVRRARKRIMQARQRGLTVHVSRSEAVGSAVIWCVMAILAVAFSVRLFSEGWFIFGVFPAVAGIFALICSWGWLHDMGRTMYRLESDGVYYNDRFIAWDTISDATMVHPYTSYRSIVLTLDDGTKFRMNDDGLSMSREELLSAIEERIDRFRVK